ncbi:MAG: hypothetical protein KKG10_10810, partial [Proteobacteria bacterium]|nr:hypothetical protein [Pseudomonadota bacterium]
IAKHYNMDLPLAMALRLEGKRIRKNRLSALCILAVHKASSERLSGNQVHKMQQKRILGTVGRTPLIAKRS